MRFYPALNVTLLFIAYLMFSSVVGSYTTLPLLLLSFVILSIVGYSALSLLPGKSPDVPYEAKAIIFFLIGLAFFTISSLLFIYFKLGFSCLIIFLAFVFMISLYRLLCDMLKIRKGSLKPDLNRFLFSKREGLFLIIIIIVIIFLLSDTLIKNQNGYYIYDPLHSTYEISIAQSIFNGFDDLSYAGKTMKFHYGSPFVIISLNKIFGFDLLVINNFMLQSVCLGIFTILLYCLAFELTKKKDISLISTFFILFGSIHYVPTTMIKFNAMCYSFIPCVNNMPSYGFGIVYLAAFFLWFLSEKNSINNLSVSMILLSGMVIFKSTIALPIMLAFALFILSLWLFKGAESKILVYIGILALPFFLLFIFVLGGHDHAIWILLPGGGFNALVPVLNNLPLLLLMLITPLLAVFIFTGFMAYHFFKYSIIKTADFFRNKAKDKQNKLCPAEKSFSEFRGYMVFFAISSSFMLAFFFVDIVELNNTQFIIPLLLLMPIIFIDWLFKTLKNKDKLRLIAVSLILISMLVTTGYFLFEKNYANTPPDDERSLNPVSSAKLEISMYNTQLVLSAVGWLDNHVGTSLLDQFRIYSKPERELNRYYYYPNGLIESLQYLNWRMGSGDIFVFGKQYEEDVTRKTLSNLWFPDSFLRTGISGKQTLIENIKFKGEIMQPGYYQRSEDISRFFYYLTDKNTLDNASWSTLTRYDTNNMFRNKPLLRRYISIFSKKEIFFDVWENYTTSMEVSIKNIIQNNISDEEKMDFIKEFIFRYNVSYILFEIGERPREDFMMGIKGIVFEEVFESGDSAVYAIKKYEEVKKE